MPVFGNAQRVALHTPERFVGETSLLHGECRPCLEWRPANRAVGHVTGRTEEAAARVAVEDDLAGDPALVHDASLEGVGRLVCALDGPELREDEMRIEHYARQNAKQWLYKIYNEREDVVSLDSIGCKISLQEVYAQIKLRQAEFNSKAVN